MNNEDKIYTIRKLAVMFTCILIFVTLGLVVINFQAKTITVNYYGEITAIKTMSNTVEGMLMQNKIYIDDKAIVYPSTDTRLTKNMEIKIYSEQTVAKLNINEYIEKTKNTITEKVVEEITYIPFEKESKSNATEDRGVANVVQKGEDGKKVTTYVVTYNGEQEVAKTAVSENVEKAALTEVVEVGTRISTVSRSIPVRATSQNVAVDGSFKEYNISLPADQQKYAYNMSQQYGIQYELFLALMYVESGFGPNKISATNDYGLCQINISNHYKLTQTLGVTNFLDPYENMQAGAYFFARYIQKWGTSEEGELNALNSYNMGEGGYRAYLNRGNDSYSWYYGKKIVAARDRLIANGGL